MTLIGQMRSRDFRWGKSFDSCYFEVEEGNMTIILKWIFGH
jgi:hypothetical protein